MIVKSFANIASKRINFRLNKIIARSFTYNKEKLQGILSNELKSEKDNYYPVDASEIKTFKDSTKFEFIESENKSKMELRKKQGNYEVIVSFHARAPINQEEQKEQQENPDNNPDNFIEFNVRVKKVGENSGLIADCISFNNNIEFSTLTYSNDVDKLYDNYQNTPEYLGPEFSTLDERIQSNFLEFFESLGINDELNSFIQVFSYDKDQRLYQKWLNDINKFI